MIAKILAWLRRTDIESRAARPPLVIPSKDPDEPVRLSTDTDLFYLDPRIPR